MYNYSSEDLHSFSDLGRYACIKYASNLQLELDKLYVDEIIEIRRISRQKKDWKLSDDLRNYLDNKLVFIFDAKDCQEVYYLNEKYFDDIEKIEKINNIKISTKRKFVEWKIKDDIAANNLFDSWLFTMEKKLIEIENKRLDEETKKILDDDKGFKNLRIYLKYSVVELSDREKEIIKIFNELIF